MMDSVCPNCGGSRFTKIRTVRERVLIDGNGEELDVLNSDVLGESDELLCGTCGNAMDSIDELVTEAFFHEVICAE